MTKNTMGTKLPRKLVQKMAIVGEQIKLARLRRNLSMAQVAERAPCSEVTLNKVEKGLPTVSMGIYLRVLYALQLDDDILLLAKEDKLGREACHITRSPEESKQRKEELRIYARYCLLAPTRKAVRLSWINLVRNFD